MKRIIIPIFVVLLVASFSGCTNITEDTDGQIDLTTYDTYGDNTGFSVTENKISFQNIPETQVFAVKKGINLPSEWELNFKLKIFDHSMPVDAGITGPTYGMHFTNGDHVRHSDTYDGDDCITFEVAAWHSPDGYECRYLRIHDNSEPWSEPSLSYRQWDGLTFDTEYDVLLTKTIGQLAVTVKDGNNVVWIDELLLNTSETFETFCPFTSDGYSGFDHSYSGEFYDFRIEYL